MHSQAVELLDTFSTFKISIFKGSFKKLPNVDIVFYEILYLLKLTKLYKSFGFPRFLKLAAHQSVYILNVF